MNSYRIYDPAGSHLVFVMISQSLVTNNNNHRHHHVCIYAYLCVYAYVDTDKRIAPIGAMQQSASVLVISYEVA